MNVPILYRTLKGEENLNSPKEAIEEILGKMMKKIYQTKNNYTFFHIGNNVDKGDWDF